MKERIVLAPGINGNELMKSLALHGVNCFNLRVCGAGELARMALMRSGIPITEKFLSDEEKNAITAEAVKEETYFENASYTDIEAISSALYRIRCLVAAGEEEQVIAETLSRGIFREKNDALVGVYRKYMEALAEKGAIDAVSLIRKASAESMPVDADFFVLEEFPLNPLEQSLLHHISEGNVNKITLQELFCAVDKPVKIESIKNCYGAANETEMILTEVYTEKRLDQCTVAVTDTDTYGQLFFDYALLYDIPITFGSGIPIINANPARLLKLYYHWLTAGFFGVEAVKEILFSSVFNRAELYRTLGTQDADFSLESFCEILGGLKLTNDGEINRKRIVDYKRAVEEEAALVSSDDVRAYGNVQKKQRYLPYLEIMAGELALPAEEFISKYTYIRKGSGSNAAELLMTLDEAAAKVIYTQLKVIRAAGAVQTAEDILLNVLKARVCKQGHEAGKLHVTGIDTAMVSIRDYLYLAGLSASKFPGSPRENYLLLDTDLKLFGDTAESATSKEKVLRKRALLLHLVRIASKLGTKIFVSYAGLNVSELKRDNASSLIFELFREERGSNVTSEELEAYTRKVDYFEPAISVSRFVGDAYNKGQKVVKDKQSINGDAEPVLWDPDRAYSPTTLDSFFKCPKYFMLRHLVGIPEPDLEDPFEIISAKSRGTLAHKLIEQLGNSSMCLEDFLKLSEDHFDRYITENPPLIAKNTDMEKRQFLEMMETAYEMEPHREIILEEEDIHWTHESGVKLYGIPDRVEKLEDGSYLIVDFKSGRRVEHVEDDINTCLQVVIYAYLMEQKGFRISGGEYRYIRLGRTIRCKYNDEMRELLAEQLEFFRSCMLSGRFPTMESLENEEGPCKFCKYDMICGKV